MNVKKVTYLNISPNPHKKAINLNIGDDYFEKSIHLNTVYVSVNLKKLLKYESRSCKKKAIFDS
jgi:hypothetical protein